MSEEQIKNILGSINYEVETDKKWVEPVGLDRDTWKALLKYIQQKENIIKEVREKIKEFCWDYDYETYSNMTSNEVKELVEILDKEVN